MSEMTEWIDVPVAEVAVGDEVKVDGFGEFLGSKSAVIELNGMCWETVTYVRPKHFNIKDGDGNTRFRRSSIVAVRRRKPEPQPKPGDWRCFRWDGFTRTPVECLSTHHPKHEGREVYRAHGGWSPDMRTGKWWVMQEGDPVTVNIPAEVGSIVMSLEAVAHTLEGWDKPLRGDLESWADYYKRIRLDVRPVDRRKK